MTSKIELTQILEAIDSQRTEMLPVLNTWGSCCKKKKCCKKFKKNGRYCGSCPKS